MVLQRQQRRPVVDLLVAFVALPILILCALQLEKNMQESWAERTDTKWIVFALGICMLFMSILICGYVTHRMGVCLWAGPLDDSTTIPISQLPSFNHVNSQNDVLRIIEALPPSYDNATKFDIMPPSYDSIIIEIKELEANQMHNSTLHI